MQSQTVVDPEDILKSHEELSKWKKELEELEELSKWEKDLEELDELFKWEIDSKALEEMLKLKWEQEDKKPPRIVTERKK